MMAKHRQRRATNGRRGFQVLELSFAVPVLALVLLATVQFGRTMMIRSSLTQAATLAAREAAKGGDIADVAQAVNCVLAVHGIAITGQPGSATKLVLQEEGRAPAQFGDPNLNVAAATAVRHGEILATVWIDPSARRTDGRSLFAPGFDLLGRISGGTQCSVSSLAKDQRAGRTAAGDGSPKDKDIDGTCVAGRDAVWK